MELIIEEVDVGLREVGLEPELPPSTVVSEVLFTIVG